MYSSALKPFVLNPNDIAFILEQVHFRPLFDAQGNAIVNWAGIGAIYDGHGALIWDGNGLTAADAINAYGTSYTTLTSSSGLRDVQGWNNNLNLNRSEWGRVDQPFLRTVAAEYGLNSHGHTYVAGETTYVTGTDQNGAAVHGSAFWANKGYGTLAGNSIVTTAGFTVPVGKSTDYAITDLNNDGAIQSGEFSNIVDYTPRMISRLVTTGGVTFATTDGQHIDYGTTGTAQVTDWGLLGSLGIQDAQARFAGTPGTIEVSPGVFEGEYFVAAQNPGVSPTNGWFTIFGQFFDHGLDFIDKGGQGKTIKISFAADDPLYGETGPDGRPATAITISRATVDSFDAAGNPQYLNHTSPFIDQSQSYGSHDDVTLLLREWVEDPLNPGTFIAGMNLLDGHTLATQWTRPDGTLTNATLPTLNELRAHVVATARADLTWEDITNYHGSGQSLILDMNPRFDDVHLLNGDSDQDTAVTDAMALLGLQFDGSGQLQLISNPAMTGVSALIATGGVNPANFSITFPSGAMHNAVGTLLMAAVGDHYIAGDGRVNENFGLTTVHHVFHEEHNFQVDNLINAIMKEADARVGTLGDGAFDADYMSQFQTSTGAVHFDNTVGSPTRGNWVADASGEIAWNFDSMFKSTKLVVEMEYQHVAIDQYARSVTPDIKEFVGYTAGENPTVSLEYAQSIFRFGHSQLRETIDTIDPDHGLTGKITGYALKLAFLEPGKFAEAGPGAIALGMTHQQGNEIDELVTPALNQGLLGLPLDLAAINIARGRDVGIPALNEFRTAVGLQAYSGWADFAENMIHPDNLVNFIAAYSFDGNLDKANAVLDLFNANYVDTAAALALANTLGLDQGVMSDVDFEAYASDFAFNFMHGGDRGIDAVDTWLGGLAEVHVTGGLLGETFNLVFVDQMERIQDGDRFYYLYRLAGQQFADEIGGGQFKDIIERNTGLTHLGGSAFSYNDQYYDLGAKREVLVGAGETNTVNNNHKYGDVVDQNGNAVVTGVEANRLGAVNGVGALTRNNQTGNAAKVYNETHNGHGVGIYTDGQGSANLDGTLTTRTTINPITGATVTLKYIRDTRTVDPNAPNGGFGIDGAPNSGANSTEVIVGSQYNDVIYARGGDDTVYGEGGDDIIFGGNGIDRLYGGDGKDWIFGEEGAELTDGGAGDDFITGDSSTTAAAGVDQLIGGMGNDIIHGGIGIDKLAGGGGDDMIYGEGDTDPFTHGGDGNDYIDGGISGDLLYGDNGDDVLVGAADQDILYGGNGDDILRPGEPSQAIGGGPDEVLGGDGVTDNGFDIMDFSDNSASAVGIVYDLTDQANPAVAVDGNTPVPAAFQIEGLVGSRNNDTLTGDNDVESGKSGWIIGAGGNDVLKGGLGNDVLIGGSIRLDALVGKYASNNYSHNNRNDNANATGIVDVSETGASATYTQEQMDFLYQGASHRVAWSEGIDNSGLLDLVNTQFGLTGDAAYAKHFTEMLRTEMFKDTVLGNSSSAGVADTNGGNDTAVFTGNFAEYTVEKILKGSTVIGLRITDTVADRDGSDIVFGVTNFNFADGTRLASNLLNSAPVITSNGGLATAAITIDEGIAAVTTVTATDADVPPQSLTYSIIGGSDAAKFQINANSGALSFVTAPNFETPSDAGTNNVYDVVVQVSDGVTNDSQAIAVTINNLDEAATGSLKIASYVANANNAVLTATNTLIDPDAPSAAFTYQWKQSAGGVGPWTNAVGGTGATTLVYTTPNAPNMAYQLVTTYTDPFGTKTVTTSETAYVGTNGNNLRTGTAGADIMLGLDGNDNFTGGLGNDLIDGGANTVGGFDRANFAQTVANSTFALNGLGQLVVSGADGTDTLTGIESVAFGGTPYSLFYGSNSSDSISGGATQDLMIGFGGDDTYIVNVGNDLVIENVGGGIDTVFSSVTHNLGANVENLTLTGTSNLAGTGNSLDNVITGNGGNNIIFGGAGNDTAVFTGALTDHTIDYTGSLQVGSIADGNDILIDFENIMFGTQAFKINAGTLGSDTLNGSVTNDMMFGRFGNDALNGNDGDDYLNGGSGLDTLNGGIGNDRFVFNSTMDSTATAANRDVIQDFRNGSDIIDLSAIDANSAAAGNQAFIWDGQLAANANLAQGHAAYYQLGGHTYLIGNSSASGFNNFSVDLVGLFNLGAPAGSPAGDLIL